MVTTVSDTIRAFLLPYARHLRDLGWAVEAATSGVGGAGLEDHFDAVHEVPWTRTLHDPRNGLAGRVVRGVLTRTRYDLVHTHTPIASFVTRLATASLPAHRRSPVVYTAHGFHFHPGGRRLRNAIFELTEKVAGRWCDRLVVINDDDLRDAQRLRLAGGRVCLLPGIGVDLDRYRATPALARRAAGMRRELGLGDDDVLYSMVAEMIPRKNHDVVLRALAALGDRRCHLALAGDGPLRPQLERRAAELSLADRTHFLGNLDDVRPCMLASAGTVLPSRREGLPRAVLESLALGVPVIGSRVRGIAELVGDDGGTLVDPDDVAGMAAALGRHARTPAGLPATVSDRLERYSEAHLLRLHEDLYAELLGGTRAAR
jgi:glycosyltransferase involved in cell wall biosynthesis